MHQCRQGPVGEDCQLLSCATAVEGANPVPPTNTAPMSCWGTQRHSSIGGCWQRLLLLQMWQLLLLQGSSRLPSSWLLLLMDAVCHSNHPTRKSVGTQVDDVPGQHRSTEALFNWESTEHVQISSLGVLQGALHLSFPLVSGHTAASC